jgi:hypothetical protein
MALGSTQPLTEINAKKHTVICEPIVKKMWGARSLTTLWAARPVNFSLRFTALPLCHLGNHTLWRFERFSYTSAKSGLMTEACVMELPVGLQNEKRRSYFAISVYNGRVLRT